MGYRIEQEGFEFQGVKLGQKCIMDDEETIVIGFDEDEYNHERFIVVKSKGKVGDMKLSQSGVVTVILNKCGSYYYDWVSLSEIELIEPLTDEENPPYAISPIHVADILEDIIKMDMSDPEVATDIVCIIVDCIRSLRE